MRRNGSSPSFAAGLLFACLLTFPALARAQMTFLGPSTPAPTNLGSLSSVAYSDKANVYLHVYEFARGVWGRFIGANGVILGQPFQIATNVLTYAGKPRVAYSGGNAVDQFFVLYATDVNLFDQGSNIFARRVQYTGAAPSGGGVIGTPIPVSPNSGLGNRRQSVNDVVYNPLTSRFMVVYEEFFSEGPDVMARQFTADGVPTGDPVNLSSGPFSQGATRIAFDWQRNRYMAVFQGDPPASHLPQGIFGVQLDGNTGAPVTPLIVIDPGFRIEPAIVYLPEADGFLVAWTTYSPDTNVVGRMVPSVYQGSVGAPYGLLVTPNLGEGYTSLEYDWVSRKTLVSAMREPSFIGGAILNGVGVPESGAFGMTTIVPAPPPNGGSFFQHLRAAANGIFGVAFNTDYSWAQFERFQFPAAATPGPKCCGVVPVPGVFVQVDSPTANQTLTPPFNIVGWAIDTRSTNGPGIDTIHAWAHPTGGGPGIFVGVLPIGNYRPDVGQAYGAQFTQSGYAVTMSNIPPGSYTLVLYPHSTVTGAFEYDKVKTININIAGGVLTVIDTPAWGQTFGANGLGMQISGWAIDLANPSFDGTDTVHIWAINAVTGAASFLGVPNPEIRLDVAQAYGQRFWESGYRLVNTTPLPAGTYYLVVYSHSYGASAFNVGRVVGVHIQ